jgi:hypothetical protein
VQLLPDSDFKIEIKDGQEKWRIVATGIQLCKDTERV